MVRSEAATFLFASSILVGTSNALVAQLDRALGYEPRGYGFNSCPGRQLQMKKISTNEIREKWLKFFESKKHLIIPSKSLIPVNDPSLLWINSGVATLKDYFTGKSTPECNRMTNSQVSLRTNDIENIGITSRHHTMFEMLGNFSIGDYFKEEAIEFGFEVLTKVYEFKLENLYFTVYNEDDITYKKWISLGVKENHILKGDKNRNFWDVGQGPCGPCTEIFYDRGEKYDLNKQGLKLFFDDLENDRFIEIWNIVFSQFNNDGKNNYTELTRKNIDTGASLERFACIIQDTVSNYETDTFLKIINGLETLGKKKYNPDAYFTNDYEQKEINKNYRIIADHIKANVFAIGDGAVPSSKERGSVLRRLIRRSMVCARKLKLKKEFMIITTNIIVNEFGNFFPNIKTNKENIIEVLEKERKLFENTLEGGYKLFENEIKNKNEIDGDVAFKLVDTYGFPFELIKEICEQNNVKLDQIGFINKLSKHKEISKANVNNVGMESQMSDLINFKDESEFIYEKTELSNQTIIGMFDKNFNKKWESSSEVWLAFKQTVFYATSGGQVSDRGIVKFNKKEFEVLDVIKAPNGQHLHLINLSNTSTINVNDKVDLKIDTIHRLNVSRNHTSAHILETVLNKVIDPSISQDGAFYNDSYFTYDFRLDRKPTEEELKKVESEINDIIKNKKSITTSLKSHDKALTNDTTAHFGSKYKKIKGGLRVVTIDKLNDVVCGGTHVNTTNDIEQLLILDLEPKGTGYWRIRCITSSNTINKYLSIEIEKIQSEINRINKLISEYKIKNKELANLLSNINYFSSIDNLKILKTQLAKIQSIFSKEVVIYGKNQAALAIANIKILEKEYSNSNKICYFICHHQDIKNVTSAILELEQKDSKYLYVGINLLDEKIQYSLGSAKNSDTIDASELIKKINSICNGSGGGNKFFAQGGTNDLSKAKDILELISEE
ncbi:MAG: alanine--tRNA ligase [Mycoplasmoidaceae bacterium]|nr:MAG: alanine--tRNA ligase [Mycoplasmoidaceae bacterium]